MWVSWAHNNNTLVFNAAQPKLVIKTIYKNEIKKQEWCICTSLLLKPGLEEDYCSSRPIGIVVCGIVSRGSIVSGTMREWWVKTGVLYIFHQKNREKETSSSSSKSCPYSNKTNFNALLFRTRRHRRVVKGKKKLWRRRRRKRRRRSLFSLALVWRLLLCWWFFFLNHIIRFFKENVTQRGRNT